MQAISAQIVALALRLGFDLPRDAVTRAVLKERDLVRIGCGPALGKCDYLQCATELRQEGERPVLRDDVAEQLLRHLHEQRWRAMRTASMREDDPPHIHFDASALSRWSLTAAGLRPDIARSLTTYEKGGSRLEVQAGVAVDTRIGAVMVSHEDITLDVELPETSVAAMPGRRLGEVLGLPSCGDHDLDREVAEEFVYTAERRAGGTVVRPYCTRLRPAVRGAETMTWRRLRAVPPDVAYDHTHLRIDVERTAAVHHARCADALGGEQQLPIPYPSVQVDD